MFLQGVHGSLFSPITYGAVGDGVTNDIVALNAAATAALAAGGYLLIPPGYTFAHAGYIVLRPGIGGVIGGGGVLKAIPGAEISGILLNGKAFGEAVSHRSVLIQGIRYDANGQNCRVIYGHGARFCVVRQNRIFNLTTGFGIIFIAEGTPTGMVPTGNLIEDNFIEGDAGTAPGYYAISVAGYSNAAPHADMATRWRAEFTVGPVQEARHNIIRRNTISGGYYAIALTACSDTKISENICTGNIRNMSIQVKSCRNTVRGNKLSESRSSGVHVAYEACDNLVEDNQIISTRAIGEGLLQCYVGSKRNTFRRNLTSCPGAGAGARYHVYCAIQCDGTVFEDNSHSGAASKAYVAVESAWNSLVTNPAHRNYQTGSDENHFANAGMTAVAIRRAVIDGSSGVPGVFASQITDSGGTFPLSVTLDSNTIGGSALPVEEYEMTDGALEVL